MTVVDLQKMMASLLESQKETDRQMKETDRQMKETDRQMKETDRKFQETAAKLDRTAELVGNIGRNNGYFAEDLFIAALKKNPMIAGIHFDQVHSRVKGFATKGREREYDVIMMNGSALGVVEVKYRLHPQDVTDFVEKGLKEFRLYFPQYSDKKLYGAVASTSIPEESIRKARELGIAVLSQEAQDIKTLSDTVSPY